ncbi:MAG: flavin reductase family protein [Gammaproteobacteria bacterium]|nr:flavin reductase family protein [Gammaproteobacteria bacterium]
MSRRSQITSLLRQLTHGVYVIGVRDQGQVNAFTASWLMQVSFDPLLVALSINPKNRSWSILEQGKVFTINVLTDKQLDLAVHFGLPGKDKLSNVAWQPGQVTQAPVLQDCLAYCECHFEHSLTAGDHQLVTAKVVNGKVLNDQSAPMLYQAAAHIDGSHVLFPDDFDI